MRPVAAAQGVTTASEPARAAPAPATPSATARVGVAPTRDHVRAMSDFKTHGFCILDAALPAVEVAALRANAEATAERCNNWHGDLYGDESAVLKAESSRSDVIANLDSAEQEPKKTSRWGDDSALIKTAKGETIKAQPLARSKMATSPSGGMTWFDTMQSPGDDDEPTESEKDGMHDDRKTESTTEEVLASYQPDADMWHVAGVLRHDQSFAPQVANSRLLAVLTDAFGVGADAAELLVTYTTLQVNRPGMEIGRGAGGWHSDGNLAQQSCYEAPHAQVHRPGHINCLWFLSDFSVENGGTWMIPVRLQSTVNCLPPVMWNCFFLHGY